MKATPAENDPRILLAYGRPETEHREVDTYSVAEIAGLRAEVGRLRAIIAWAGNEEAVRVAGLVKPSPEEPSHAH